MSDSESLSDEEVIELLLHYSPNETKYLPNIEISQLESEMRLLLCNIQEPKPADVKRFEEILDPNRTGFFHFATLLALVAEKTKQIEIERRPLRDGNKYGLRPRDKLRCPSKWTGFDSFTYAKRCNSKCERK